MDIQHHPEQHRFTLTQNGETAHVAYRIENGALDIRHTIIENGALDIRHTIVPAPLEGQGIASALVKAAYDYALQQGYRCVATCAYAVRWLQRHPEYNGTPSQEYCEGNACAL